MILNKKPTNEKKTEEELSRYFSILKSLLFEVERNIPCVRHIKMKPSKSTDSLYATVYFNDIPQALKLTVRHHTKRIQEKDFGALSFASSQQKNHAIATILKKRSHTHDSIDLGRI